MRYHLEHLWALYTSYVKLALSGLVLSSLLFLGYSALKTDHLLFGFAFALFLFGIATGIINMQRRRVVLRGVLEQQELRQRETEAILERSEQRLREAKQYVGGLNKSNNAHVGDFQEAILVHELVILIEQLQSLNTSRFLIDKAVEQFLNLQEEVGDNSKLTVLREKVFDSIKKKIVFLPPNKPNEDRKVAG